MRNGLRHLILRDWSDLNGIEILIQVGKFHELFLRYVVEMSSSCTALTVLDSLMTGPGVAHLRKASVLTPGFKYSRAVGASLNGIFPSELQTDTTFGAKSWMNS
jgi:hypothetical protein